MYTHCLQHLEWLISPKIHTQEDLVLPLMEAQPNFVVCTNRNGRNLPPGCNGDYEYKEQAAVRVRVMHFPAGLSSKMFRATGKVFPLPVPADTNESLPWLSGRLAFNNCISRGTCIAPVTAQHTQIAYSCIFFQRVQKVFWQLSFQILTKVSCEILEVFTWASL